MSSPYSPIRSSSGGILFDERRRPFCTKRNEFKLSSSIRYFMPRYISFATILLTKEESCQSTLQSLYLSFSNAENNDLLLSLVKKLGIIRILVLDNCMFLSSSISRFSDKPRLAIRQIRIILFIVKTSCLPPLTCRERLKRRSINSFNGRISSVIPSAWRIFSKATSIVLSS